jgi:hypothetical protein
VDRAGWVSEAAPFGPCRNDARLVGFGGFSFWAVDLADESMNGVSGLSAVGWALCCGRLGLVGSQVPLQRGRPTLDGVGVFISRAVILSSVLPCLLLSSEFSDNVISLPQKKNDNVISTRFFTFNKHVNIGQKKRFLERLRLVRLVHLHRRIPPQARCTPRVFYIRSVTWCRCRHRFFLSRIPVTSSIWLPVPCFFSSSSPPTSYVSRASYFFTKKKTSTSRRTVLDGRRPHSRFFLARKRESRVDLHESCSSATHRNHDISAARDCVCRARSYRSIQRGPPSILRTRARLFLLSSPWRRRRPRDDKLLAIVNYSLASWTRKKRPPRVDSVRA